MKLVITCEHGGNEIPREYQNLFVEAEQILNSHRGFDPGALDLFNHLSGLADFSYSHTISRLLIELNRSQGHHQFFSEFTRELPSEEKKVITDNYYLPYRKKVENEIASYKLQGEEVLHLSIHSFTPVLNGKKRMTDVGLLYDPSRLLEKKIARQIKKLLVIGDPGLRVRYNYPYLGIADGFTTSLRKKFPANYAGIEIEVNQKFVEQNKISQVIKNPLFEVIQNIKTFIRPEK